MLNIVDELQYRVKSEINKMVWKRIGSWMCISFIVCFNTGFTQGHDVGKFCIFVSYFC